MRLPATFHCITGFLAGVSTNKIHPVPLSRSPGILAEIPVHNKEGLELSDGFASGRGNQGEDTLMSEQSCKKEQGEVERRSAPAACGQIWHIDPTG